MQLNISGHHVTITPELRDYVDSKMERVRRHFDQITRAHVVLSVDKLVKKAEVTMHVTSAELFAEAEEADLFAAIDAMADKLDRQVRRHKEKVTSHR